MDSWLKLFKEQILPNHLKCGIPVVNAWVNADGTEFIWVRSFASSDDIPVKEAEYLASPERRALGEIPESHLARMEVRVMEPVLSVPGTA